VTAAGDVLCRSMWEISWTFRTRSDAINRAPKAAPITTLSTAFLSSSRSADMSAFRLRYRRQTQRISRSSEVAKGLSPVPPGEAARPDIGGTWLQKQSRSFAGIKLRITSEVITRGPPRSCSTSWSRHSSFGSGAGNQQHRSVFVGSPSDGGTWRMGARTKLIADRERSNSGAIENR
jgi:hypothetical protein